jgi:hypothetical protein
MGMRGRSNTGRDDVISEAGSPRRRIAIAVSWARFISSCLASCLRLSTFEILLTTSIMLIESSVPAAENAKSVAVATLAMVLDVRTARPLELT